MNRSLATHPLFVACVWLASYWAAIVLTIESLLGDITPAAMQLMAKLLAYMGASGNVGFMLVSLVLFTIASGLTLRWLGTAVAAHTLARLVAGSCWPMIVFTWCIVGMVTTTPPPGLTIEEIIEVPDNPQAVGDLLGFTWLTEAQYAVTAASLTILSISLARRCGWFNAIIGIAGGLATIALISAALVRLITLHEGLV